MKAGRFLVTLLGCGVFMQGLGFAEPPNPASEPASSEQTASTPSNRPDDDGPRTEAHTKREGIDRRHAQGKNNGGGPSEKNEQVTKAGRPQAPDRLKEARDRKEPIDRKSASRRGQETKDSSQDRVKSPPGDRKHMADRRSGKNSSASAIGHPQAQDRVQAVQKNGSDHSVEKRAEGGQPWNPRTNSLRTVSTSAGAKAGVRANKGDSHYRAQATVPTGAASGVLSPSGLHPRGPAPAIVGGAVSPSPRTTAAITGTGMSHRF